MITLTPELFRILRLDRHSKGAEAIVASAEQLGARQRAYPAGAIILDEGEPSTCVRLIKSGWVAGATQLRDGSRQIIDVHLNGDLLVASTVAGVSRVTLQAIDRAVILEFPQQRLMSYFEKRPEIARYFAAASARLNAIRVEHLVNLGHRGAAARTAHFFLELAERTHPGLESVAVEFECPLTQADLADALGMTAIHYNRTLRDLRLLGLVTFRKGSVLINDRYRLAKLADFNPDYLRTYHETDATSDIGGQFAGEPGEQFRDAIPAAAASYPVQ
jgi:CRP-like cAMP-binding protein